MVTGDFSNNIYCRSNNKLILTQPMCVIVDADVQGVSCRMSGCSTKELTGNLEEMYTGVMKCTEMSV